LPQAFIDVLEIKNISSQAVPILIKPFARSSVFAGSGEIVLGPQASIVVEENRCDLAQLRRIEGYKLIIINESKRWVGRGPSPVGSSGSGSGTGGSGGGGGLGGTLCRDDQDKVPAPCAGANYLPTGLTLTHTPVVSPGGGWTVIAVNGLIVELGNGVRTKDCYFSSDGGATAKSAGYFTIGNELYWNALIAGFSLDASDNVSFLYMV
jgi:hypothetical protein